MFALLIFAIQFLPAASAGGHAHGAGTDFEWAGIFATPGNTYLWTAQKTKIGGVMKYADNTMKMAVLPASAATEAVLDGAAFQKEGRHSLSMTCKNVVSGGVITPKEDECYNLQFKQDWWQETTFKRWST